MKTVGLATVIAMTLYAAVAAAPVATTRQQGHSVSKTEKPPTILFMCPYGAAKSVLASAYFRRLATERGLNVRVISAGTEPDPQVAPAVANHLKRNGYEVPISKPRRVTETEVSTADVVISIGCDLTGCPRLTGRSWSGTTFPPSAKSSNALMKGSANE